MNEDVKTDLESDKNFYAPHPRKAQKIIGHEQVREKFLASYNSGKLHHAWLICGPEGIGKATLAWQIAKLLLNKGTSFDETNFPSNTIVSQRLEALSEPSLFLCRRQFDKVKKKYFQDISVEEIRKIKHFFSLTSTQSNWRIVIIDTIDDLSNSAANSLLKVLEEPPKGGLFLLICKNKNNLLPTIISRCQLLECGYLSLNEFEKILIDLKIFDTKEHDLQVLFSLINGSISKAIDFKLNNGLNILRKIASIIGFQKKMNRKDIWEILDKNNSSLNQKEYNLDENPDDIEAVMGMAQVFENAEKWRKAEKFYRELIAIDPENPEHYRGMSRVKLQQGEPDQSKRFLDKAKALGG